MIDKTKQQSKQQKSKKPNHPWRGNFEHGKRMNNKDLYFTRISSFNRMGIRI